ncbi:RNHCP domain-containing protein [Candidatus Beckwithbacteria bacterium]|nr:RNHCP domain-containing protein [Candidatus Beckwithbacteria bacterium]
MQDRKNFIKPEAEKVICEHCGKEFNGGGYRDHCPFCLFGKHVDLIIPGDRKASCKTLMEPILALQKNNKWRIKYRCLGCKHEFIVDSFPDDNFDLILELAQMV